MASIAASRVEPSGLSIAIHVREVPFVPFVDIDSLRYVFALYPCREEEGADDKQKENLMMRRKGHGVSLDF
jgi:hypothetical protein